MRSAVEAATGGRAAIVRAATDLVARRGPDATTVRAVAEAAGVSAALVIHHFGTKDGLLRACDEHVQAAVAALVEAIVEHPDDLSVPAFLAVPDIGPTIDYVARSLQAGGDVGRWWFEEMATMSDDMLARMAAAGTARELADPQMSSLLLLALDVGLLLLRPLVEARLGAGLTDPTVLERWVRAEHDLLAHGLFAEPTDPTTDREEDA